MTTNPQLTVAAAVSWVEGQMVSLPPDDRHVIYRGGDPRAEPGEGRIEPNIKIQAVVAGTRVNAFRAALVEMNALSSGDWRQRAQQAWNIAAQACRRAGLFAEAEVAWANVEAAEGVIQRHISGESGGWLNINAIKRALWETGEDLKEFNPLPDPDQLKWLAWVSRNAWWLAPVAVSGIGLAYFWPVVTAAMMKRRAMKTALGLPARLTPTPADYDEALDPFAGTQDIPALPEGWAEGESVYNGTIEDLAFFPPGQEKGQRVVSMGAPAPLAGTVSGFSTFALRPLNPGDTPPWEK